jgi:integrase
VLFPPFKASHTSFAEMQLYDYDVRIGRYCKIIEGLRNGKIALEFINHLWALGLSRARVSAYAGHLITLLRQIDFNLKKVKRKDVERVVAWINSNENYTEATKRDKKVVLKRLIQYAKYGSCDKKTPLPPEVSWIRIGSIDNDETRVKPEDILTEDELKALLIAAKHPRDKAAISVLYEGALRPGEFFSMKIRSVEFKEGYCIATVKGKTGLKRIPLVTSYKYLLDWVNSHPQRQNPDAPLWLMVGKGAGVKPLSYNALRIKLRKLAKKAGLNKDVWPYLFRHTALTGLAKRFTEPTLCLYAGWVQGSKMPRRYVHFSMRDLEDEVLKIHGMRSGEKRDGILKAQICPRCGSRNEPDKVRCNFCGLVLDEELALKMFQEDGEKLAELSERLERLEQLISSLLSSKRTGDFEQCVSTPQFHAESPSEPHT